MGGRTADELGKLIEQTTAQDDMNQLVQQVSDQDEFDQLVRKAMREEEPKVLRAVGTKEEEGFRTRVYRDTVGKRTIGIGFNMDAPGARDRWVKAGVKTDFNDALNGRKTITKQEAEALFELVKGETELQARKLVRNYATLGKHQQAALKDMVYQLGASGAMAFARTRALIEKGDFSGAARALLDSRNAEQTPARVKRRAYMLQHDVSMAVADAALVKQGSIPRSQSINTPQELSRLMGEVKVAAAPAAAPAPDKAQTKPAPKKRVRYAEAKAKRGIA
jgi:lysozyme